MSFSKCPKHLNALICIAPDKGHWQPDKGLAKIAEDASPRRHAEISPVKVKDTHLMNNKLPPLEILGGECVALYVIPPQCATITMTS